MHAFIYDWSYFTSLSTMDSFAKVFREFVLLDRRMWCGLDLDRRMRCGLDLDRRMWCGLDLDRRMWCGLDLDRRMPCGLDLNLFSGIVTLLIKINVYTYVDINELFK